MWTLVLITFIVSGASTGGVATTTSYLDFPNEAKCKEAADTMAGAAPVNLVQHPNHPNISPSAIYRIVSFCVER